MIDEEVERILREQEARATELLTKHRRGLDLVAEALLEHETIDGAEVARIVHESLGEGPSDAVAPGRRRSAADDAPAAESTPAETSPRRASGVVAEVRFGR